MMSLRHYFVCGLLSLLMMVMETNSATPGKRAAISWPAFKYEGKLYYLHRHKFYSYQEAIDACKNDGAQLTVIRNRSQFNEIRDYLHDIPKTIAVYVAGSRADKDGDWVLPGSKKPLPYTYFLPIGHQSNRDGQNCVALYDFYEYTMYAFPCEQNLPQNKYRFLCEKQA